MKNDTQEMLNLVAQTIFDKKGTNIIALDVSDVSTLTDYILVAEGNVDRHVVALAKTVMDVLREHGESPAYVEGMQNGDWVVLDYINFMVHIFMPGLREKYQLERLWAQGKIVDLSIEVPRESARI